ncbi:MAG TPA: FAD-binding oxidoreductase [Candidatus Nitrosotalea sp.]|nr:FAD-binding oxidoreductase [Candidatus Nitrosotalea sp.]
MKPSQVGPSLSKIVKCAVSWDRPTQNFYSVDASSYKLKPLVVTFPRNESDVVKIIKFAKKYHIPVTPRGAGTGLVGSALGNGIILDMRHFDEIKLGKNHVKVGSGVFKGRLDKILKKQGRFIGPDPSIGPYCTIGGMIGTNASGIHSVKYGSVIDNLIQVRMVSSHGIVIKLPGNHNFKNITKNIRPAEIQFPKVSKNSCGYRIDRISTEKDLHKLIVGSEGTLGIVTSAKLRTYALPKNILLCTIHYNTLTEAARDIPKIMELKPSAVEIVDRNIAKHIKIKIPSQTGCLLFVEFDETIQSNKKRIYKIISGTMIKTDSSMDNIKKLWNFRNSALAYSLQSITKSETMPTLIEDAVVPVKRLPLLLKMLDMISKKYGLKVIIYGHAGNGNLHIRPIIRQKEAHLIKKIASEFFSGVISIGGSITGEHGDGLARSEFVKMQYGKKIYHIFKQVKKQFDPENILNPGKIISTHSTVTRNLKS